MGMRIEGGKTGVNTLLIDSDGKAEVRAVVETEAQWAAEKGNSFNLNTGTVNLTTNGVSGVMYVKSNEDDVLIIEQIIVGVGEQLGTTTEGVAHVKIIRNPTSVSFSTAADMSQNRNFGSSKTLDSGTLVYKGADSATVTGGDETILFYVGEKVRMAAPINLELQKGNSLAVTVDPNDTSTNVYIALVCHLKESEFVA